MLFGWENSQFRFIGSWKTSIRDPNNSTGFGVTTHINFRQFRYEFTFNRSTFDLGTVRANALTANMGITCFFRL